MIPLRDNIAHRRFPVVTVSLIIVNTLVFLHEVSLGRYIQDFIYLYGFTPKYVFSQAPIMPKFMPFFTSMFLHAGWLHLIGNMWFLWIFADNVEDVLGHFNFLIFYIACGLAASFAHFIMNINSVVPAVGASGAIAGILGAYIVMFPRARVLTLVPVFIFLEVIEIPAFVFLGIWFIYQFFLGMMSVGSYGAGVAFWAHIGGFIAGILFLRLFFTNRSGYPRI
ncbi:MAG: rhomboid family intramembrane serine protease [Candidatus Omnitrophica bacterium 4484_171]|nr:MAG: rhomboid family intramembrane serine protease [Candidatus Omnitrophica bacterium 4484_171]